MNSPRAISPCCSGGVDLNLGKYGKGRSRLGVNQGPRTSGCWSKNLCRKNTGISWLVARFVSSFCSTFFSVHSDRFLTWIAEEGLEAHFVPSSRPKEDSQEPSFSSCPRPHPFNFATTRIFALRICSNLGLSLPPPSDPKRRRRIRFHQRRWNKTPFAFQGAPLVWERVRPEHHLDDGSRPRPHRFHHR